MSRAFLPFLPRFHGAIRDGRKVATCRTKAYGKDGDVVDSPVGPLRLLKVRPATLGEVKRDLYLVEGLDTPQEFEDVWREIHPRAGFDPAKVVQLHVFELCNSVEKPYDPNPGGIN